MRTLPPLHPQELRIGFGLRAPRSKAKGWIIALVLIAIASIIGYLVYTSQRDANTN